jgi:type VI secretion system secreted protein VgrG
MPGRKANQPQHIFVCGNLDPSTFGVINFSGSDSISSPYEFSINLKSPKADISADDVVNKQATLSMYREGEYFLYSGVILEFAYIDTNVDFSSYHVIMVPKLQLLDFNVQTRVFQKMTVPDIVKNVLDDGKLSDYYEVDLQGTYPEREYVIQYKESDLNFISRLLEEAGIWYFFKELPILPEEVGSPGTEKLIISDKPASFEFINGESEIVFRSGSGLHEKTDQADMESVTKVSSEKRVVSQNVKVKYYNYRTPEVDLSSQKAVSTGQAGTVYNFGEEIKDTDGADKSADVIAKRIASSQADITGVSNCPGFRAGSRFTLTEHVRDECNDKYLLRNVTHKGGHSGGGGSSTYSSYINDFTAIASEMIENFKPPVTAKIPKINGIMTAAIEASGSDYASLDDMGRYKVRMPFDISDNANYDASKYMRLAQPYSGSNYGIHFPSHEGAEMVFGCIDGNPDKPLGIGTVPNANTVSPVVSGNKAQGVIRTAGGNEMIMDDTAEKQKVTINSNAKNIILLDDENKKIEIKTTGGDDGNNQIVMDDQNKSLKIGGLNHGIKFDYGDGGNCITIQTEAEHMIKIDDENQIITVKTAGGHAVQMDDSGKTITIEDGDGKNTVTLDGGGGLSLDSQGEIKITAKADLVIEAANIKMTAKQAIEETASTDLKMKGMNVESKADMNMTVEGGMNTEVTGMMLKAEGKTMADFKGGAKTTVTGGVVMIN